MKCPKCNYVSHDYLDTCRKCSMNLAVFKQQIGLFVLQPGALNLSAVLGNRSGSESFDGADTRVGVEDFDISLDDYSDRPVMRRAPGTFIRPDMQQEGGNLQHLTLQLDAAAMSTELPRSMANPPAESPRSPGSQGPPPLPAVNSPEDDMDSAQGHLTLDLGVSGDPLNSGAGILPPPAPRGGSPSPTPPAGRDRTRLPDEERTAERNTLPPAGSSEGPRASAVLPHHVNLDTERDVKQPSPMLESTSGETRRRPERLDPPQGGTQTEDGGVVTLPTLQLFVEDTFDGSPSIMEPAAGNSQVLHPEPSRDAVVTTDSIEVVKQTGSVTSTMPGPGEMLPSGIIPQVGRGTPGSRQPAGDTLDELTASDFGGENSALNAPGAATSPQADPGLLDDENPFQFDLDEIDLDAANGNRDQGTQHESMPGRLTLELDVGAMSMELSSASLDNPASPNVSETERRTIELRLDREARTNLPEVDAAFTSLADTDELEVPPKGAPSSRLGTSNRNPNAPSAPEAGRGPTDATGEFLLDLEDMDEDPRPR